MADFLSFTLDKFTFAVATDRLYTADGVWVKEGASRITVGLSDFFQQRHGDVAFAEVAEAGASIKAGDELATIETIKVDLELVCPVSGTITAVNEDLELEAELINQDPYGRGWLAAIAANDWTADQAKLMTPEQYYQHIQLLAQEDLS